LASRVSPLKVANHLGSSASLLQTTLYVVPSTSISSVVALAAFS